MALVYLFILCQLPSSGHISYNISNVCVVKQNIDFWVDFPEPFSFVISDTECSVLRNIYCVLSFKTVSESKLWHEY